MKVFSVHFGVTIFFIIGLFSACDPNEEPQLAIDKSAINFGADNKADQITLTNSGEGTITWEITQKPDWLSVSKSEGTITSGSESITLIADFSQAFGEYYAAMIIESNAGNVNIDLTLDVPLSISSWTDGPTLNEERVYFDAAVLNGKIYAVGGYKNPTTFAPNIEVFDPAKNSWSIETQLPQPRGAASVEAIDGKLYIFGGVKGIGANHVADVDTYDPEDGSWDSKAPMMTPNAYRQTVVLNNKVYAIGGTTTGKLFSDDVEEYDLVTNRWTKKAPLNKARSYFSSAVVDGKIYVFGGVTNTEYRGIRSVEMYDPAIDSWTEVGELPVQCGFTGAVVSNGHIFVIGGDRGGTDADWPGLGTTQIYNPANNSWSKASVSLYTKRRGMPAVVLDNKIYVIGGTTGYKLPGFKSVEVGTLNN